MGLNINWLMAQHTINTNTPRGTTTEASYLFHMFSILVRPRLHPSRLIRYRESTIEAISPIMESANGKTYQLFRRKLIEENKNKTVNSKYLITIMSRRILNQMQQGNWVNWSQYSYALVKLLIMCLPGEHFVKAHCWDSMEFWISHDQILSWI